MWDDAYKRSLAANRRVANVAAAGFLSRYLSGPLLLCLTPYNRKYNVLSASLNKTFPFFLLIR